MHLQFGYLSGLLSSLGAWADGLGGRGVDGGLFLPPLLILPSVNGFFDMINLHLIMLF